MNHRDEELEVSFADPHATAIETAREARTLPTGATESQTRASRIQDGQRIAALALTMLLCGLGVALSGCGGSGSTNGGGGSGGSGGGGGTTPTAATPIFSPAAGAYTSAQSVTVSDSTSGATIYYTTDGSTPTASSTKYSGAITVSATETINAIATASGYNNSAVATAAYTINSPAAATPTFSPAAGAYTGAQTVSISDSTSGAAIYYTTDGSTPIASSTKYSGAITVLATETINAIATASGYANSAVASATYTINLSAAAAPVFSPGEGTYTAVQSVTISDATPGATIYYTTDGSTPNTGSTKYAGAISVSSTETIKAIATASGYNSSAVASATYTLNLTAATPAFSVAAGTYTSAFYLTLSDTTPNATIYYTTDGSTPTTSSSRYTAPFAITQSETVKAIAVASGYNNSPVANATYSFDIDTSIITRYQFWQTSATSGYITYTSYGTSSGAPSGTAPSQLATAQITNSNNDTFSYVQVFQGGPALSESTYSSVSPIYFMDQGATGATIYANTLTKTGSAGSSAVQETFQTVNTQTLPTLTGGSSMTGYFANSSTSINLGGTLYAGGSTSPNLYCMAVNSTTGGIGTPTLAQTKTTPTGNLSGLQADAKGNIYAIFGTGATAITDVFGSSCNELLDNVTAGLGAGSNGSTALTVTPLATGTSSTISVPSGYSGPNSLALGSQYANGGGTNAFFNYVQEGTNGGAATVANGMIPNPNGAGVPFGLAKTFLADWEPSTGLPQSIYVIDQAAGSGGTDLAIWRYSVTPVAGLNNNTTLQLTETGYASIAGSGGANATVYAVVNNNALFVASNTQAGVFMIPKNSDGTLGSSTEISTMSSITALQTDGQGNVLALSTQNIYTGISAKGQNWFATIGGSAALANPSVGNYEYIGPTTTASAQFRASSTMTAWSGPNADPANTADSGGQQ